ncbi:hypothetical protein [Brevibacterium spongiae]|uniref:DUF3800 domain-containing protein n=1 Tax=Brevibacterium spongiae TaxID=2909672 RepID=A0ABY5SKX3_9MICO|nr:hypothetical protein [Brevibacterium spongiae]UVI35158.1 hypothetical protein L1F31_13670 [Brevibacterium spongiae]
MPDESGDMSSPSLRSLVLERFYLAAAPNPIAFIDESMRQPTVAGKGPAGREISFYQMAAVIFSHARLDSIRERLVDVAGGTYWHTNKKFRGSDFDRGDIVEMIATVTEESVWNVIAVRLPLAGSSRRDLARARALCLDRLVRNLTSGTGDEAVRGIVADNNKDQKLNGLDEQVVDKLRSSGSIHSDVALAHGRMGAEPLLWSADAMSWAVQRNILRDDVRFIEPALREGKLTVINAVDGKSLNMKHPLGACAKTRGPSSQRPGLSGSPGHDVASPSTIPARFAVDNGALSAPGQSVGRDLLRQIRAFGEDARRSANRSWTQSALSPDSADHPGEGVASANGT